MNDDAVCRLCRRSTRSTRLDSTGACETCHPPVALEDVVDRLPDDVADAIARCLRRARVPS